MFHVDCGVGIKSRCVAERRYKNVGGYEIVVRSVYSTKEKLLMNIVLLMALEGRDVRKCGMNDVFLFFEVLHLSYAGGKMWSIRRVFCCTEVKFGSDVGV